MQEDIVCPSQVPVCVCNQRFLEFNLILSQGVNAGPTLGLIPSVHLQRHCQSVSATNYKKGLQGNCRGEAGAEVDREGLKKEKREGRSCRGGGDRKRAEWKEFTVEGGGEFLTLPCGQPSQVSQSQQQALCLPVRGSVVFPDSTNTARNRGGSWKFNRGVAADERRAGGKEEVS